MQIHKDIHPWDVSVPEAKKIQEQFAAQINIRKSKLKTVQHVLGADISFNRFQKEAACAVVVIDITDMTVIESICMMKSLSFPYIPGYLSFRELPLLLPMLEQITSPVDLIIVDGQGYAHPRRFGLACHLGIWCDIPTIGVAKSLLVGELKTELPAIKNSVTEIMDGQEQIGIAVRAQEKCKPVFGSPGNNITFFETAVWITRLTTKYRINEPIRQAHILANQLRMKQKQP